MADLLKPHVAARCVCELGEGPAWFAKEGLLRFVDIKGGATYSYDPQRDVLVKRPFPGEPSFQLPAHGGSLVGSRQSLFFVPKGAEPVAIQELPIGPEDRTNDATVDPSGRLWFGTMHDPERESTGAIWCFDGSAITRAWGSAIVTNGPAVANDGRTIYWADSPGRLIWRGTIAGSCRIEDAQVFLRLGPDEGYPDGLIIDALGCLWVALWDGWALRRYSSDGQLMMVIPMPCARITKAAFGGSNLDTLYITTARVGLDEAALAEQPGAGSLFAVKPGVNGRPLPNARLRTYPPQSAWRK